MPQSENIRKLLQQHQYDQKKILNNHNITDSSTFFCFSQFVQEKNPKQT